MPLLVVGLNHRSAPIEVREKLAFSEPQIPEGVRALVTEGGAQESAILSTCNRAEFYVVRPTLDGAFEATLEHLARARGLDCDALRQHCYHHHELDAARHLFRVASGIDSMVTGESQILGQVRDAYRWALDAGTAQRLLNELFQRALNIGKRARAETAIGEGNLSVGSAAADLAVSIFGDLTDKRVLLIGAGEICTLTARHLLGQGVQTTFIANRTYERAVALAEELGGTAVPFRELETHLPEVDIVLSSTSAPHYVLEVKHVQAALKARRQQPMFLIDLAVPRDLDPAIDRLSDVYLYNIDALSEIVEHNRLSREEEAQQVAALIDEEAESFGRWLRALAVRPLLRELTSRYEQLSTAEVESVLHKLPSLSPREQELVRALAKRIRTKMLHPVLTCLRELGESGSTEQELELVKKLFGLTPEGQEHGS